LKTEKAYNARAGKIIEFESFFPYWIKFERDFINREVNGKGGDLREVIENAKEELVVEEGSYKERKGGRRWSVQQGRENGD
jgi:hypothetical protein